MMNVSGLFILFRADPPARGTVVAAYDYDPFGRTVRQSGPYAAANPWRFSTKQTDEWGLYYYGYRYYSPGLGRWLNRDPMPADDAADLYLGGRNDLIDNVDAYGLLRNDNYFGALTTITLPHERGGVSGWCGGGWEAFPPALCLASDGARSCP